MSTDQASDPSGDSHSSAPKRPSVDSRPALPPRDFNPAVAGTAESEDGVNDGTAQDSAPQPDATLTTIGADEQTPGSLSCVVMGPGAVGKTTLIAAIDQACHMPGPSNDEIALTYVGGEGSDSLMGQVFRTILEEDQMIGHTDRAARYGFSVTAQRRRGFWSANEHIVANVTVADGPGGALFPTADDIATHGPLAWEAELIERGRQADLLVLCLDPTDPRHSGMAHQFISGLLARMAAPCVDDLEATVHPLGFQVRRRLGLARRPGHGILVPRLRAKRFLLLLTKIDRLVLGYRGERAGGLGGGTPRQLADRLDPVSQASHLLGTVVLGRIASALSRTAKFGIGVCSAWGFDAVTEQPFMTAQGADPLMLHSMPRGRRPAQWAPFGVREAIVFLLTGQAEGTVRLIDRDSLCVRPMGRPFPANQLIG